jgi:hypothetical protein
MTGEAGLIERADGRRVSVRRALDVEPGSMSDQMIGAQRRWSQSTTVPMMAIVGSSVLFVIAAGLEVPRVEVALRPMPAALASLVNLDWPRWIHNLADLLQILTPVVAILAWGSTRRRRPPTAGSSSKVGSSTPD